VLNNLFNYTFSGQTRLDRETDNDDRGWRAWVQWETDERQREQGDGAVSYSGLKEKFVFIPVFLKC
jgi:hypothetical protein